MFTRDPKVLASIADDQRLWEGIPSIEVTPGGRTFICFYGGGVKEQIGNYVTVLKSEDDVHFTTFAAIMPDEHHRCFDPCLWIDPLGRLWLTWSQYPDDAEYGVILTDPDAPEDKMKFSQEFFIGNNIMMNKPTVLKDGTWLFPLAVWKKDVFVVKPDDFDRVRGSFVYATSEKDTLLDTSAEGSTPERTAGEAKLPVFVNLGHVDMPERHCDEHMVLEQQDGSLTMFVRTLKGIGTATSTDGGRTWQNETPHVIPGPNSRFHIRRLPSGRVLLINHYEFTGRNNLTAFLSEDDGKTFPYRLLLDERAQVSYPDAAISPEGVITITYDRERGAYMKTKEAALAAAREILTARITEEDILAGKLVSEGSWLKRVVHKLGEYNGPDLWS